MNRYPLASMVTLMIGLSAGCGPGNAPLHTVDELDLNRYAGQWYEIARLPNRFERGLKCVTATYEVRSDGQVNVVNRGVNEDDPNQVDEATGKASVPDASKPGELRVVFFWPFGGDYFVIDLADDYSSALVGSPDRKYLWILAREPNLEPLRQDELVAMADSLGFNVQRLYFPLHDC